MMVSLLMNSSSKYLGIKEYLDEQYHRYCHSSFIDDDPIQVPHQFSSLQNIEISGFFAATFAWGQRKTIIGKATELMKRMDNQPLDFIRTFSTSDLNALRGFKHRTFDENDGIGFVYALSDIYRNYDSMDAFLTDKNVTSPLEAARELYVLFSNNPHVGKKTMRHVANVESGSAAKRLNMFFRWMVRTRKEGVDFGMWNSMKPSQLLIPLDLHVGNVSRELGLLTRTQNDLKAVVELTSILKEFDSNDPIKYDFALFSIGVNS